MRADCSAGQCLAPSLQRLWPAYTDASGAFFAGQWQSEPGKWSVSYTEEEYCEILAGRSTITDAQGTALTEWMITGTCSW